jgi:hypothetical protein
MHTGAAAAAMHVMHATACRVLHGTVSLCHPPAPSSSTPQVAAAGGASCAAVCDAVLQPALSAVIQDVEQGSAAGGARLRPLQADCGVLALLHCVLRAAGTALSAAAAGDGGGGAAAAAAAGSDAGSPLTPLYLPLTSLGPRVVSVVRVLQPTLAVLQDAESFADDAVALCQQQQQLLQVWLLLVWGALLALPPCASGLQRAHADAAAAQLVQQALDGGEGRSTLLMHPRSTSTSVSGAAMAAAATLACWGGGGGGGGGGDSVFGSGLEALRTHAAPLLLTALMHGGDRSRRAAATLESIARSGSWAAWEVLQWLRPGLLPHVCKGDWVSALLRALHWQHTLQCACSCCCCC